MWLSMLVCSVYKFSQRIRKRSVYRQEYKHKQHEKQNNIFRPIRPSYDKSLLKDLKVENFFIQTTI